MQFLGNIEAKMDAKTRVFVPAAFRKILQTSGQNTLILRKDIFQDCLILYPLQVWEDEVARLRSRLNRWYRAQQALFRQFVVAVVRLELVANGRILIPKRYFLMVGIVSELRFLGGDTIIEIRAHESLDDTLIYAY